MLFLRGLVKQLAVIGKIYIEKKKTISEAEVRNYRYRFLNSYFKLKATETLIGIKAYVLLNPLPSFPPQKINIDRSFCTIYDRGTIF